jgi:hypothetical protein
MWPPSPGDEDLRERRFLDSPAAMRRYAHDGQDAPGAPSHRIREGQDSLGSSRLSPSVRRYVPASPRRNPARGQHKEGRLNDSPARLRRSPARGQHRPLGRRCSPSWGQHSPCWVQYNSARGKHSPSWGRLAPARGNVAIARSSAAIAGGVSRQRVGEAIPGEAGAPPASRSVANPRAISRPGRG